MASHAHLCSIVPPHILHRLADADDLALRHRARQTLALSDRLRGRRGALAATLAAVISAGAKRRTVYDARHGTALPGKLVRTEDGSSSADVAVEEAFTGAGDTYDFYHSVFDRNSIDDHGFRLDSTVHYSVHFDNAFWDGRQMVYGDGDGVIFKTFTSCLDIVGHEITHGVTSYEADLAYHDQPGALNESISDVFGSLIKQWRLGQSAADADWLIGAGLLGPTIKGRALRSMSQPGTAYDDPILGKDPQPADMKHFVKTADDDGGVHINSGIPNHAFYVAAIDIGGRAWEKAGAIWYDALTKYLRPNSGFQAAAAATVIAAAVRFGQGSLEQKAVRKAWDRVGVEAHASVTT